VNSDFSLKAGSAHGGNKGIERHGVEASSTGPSSSNKRKNEGRGLHMETVLVEQLALVEVDIDVTGKIP
jgi:hypothetical protein